MEILLAIAVLLVVLGLVYLTFNRGGKGASADDESWTLDSAEESGEPESDNM